MEAVNCRATVAETIGREPNYLPAADRVAWPCPPLTRGLLCVLLLAGMMTAVVGAEPAAIAAPRLSLDQLVNEPNLTPEQFMHHFADFKFCLGDAVRKPETFLANKAGDCDDFATLAADILARKGYTTRLVVIHMQRDIHVVCYVNEIKGFLDYNHRQDKAPIIPSNGTLSDIGRKVAADFRSDWRTASEFVYLDGRPKYLGMAFR